MLRPTPDQERMTRPVLKQICFFRKRPDMTMDEFMDYEPMGGGGTEFDVNWDYMKENDICPKKFIMFTDGYPWGSWGDELYCDTVFIIHGNDTIVPPFGEYAYYEALKEAA